ncbi:MAG: DUF393 domain-containing protein [Pseudomonadales bacterium]|nr:DUF393 domain-containing protein [Pseudomonadales bacterium]
MSSPHLPPNNKPIMLFDSDCALCNGTVQFVLDYDQAENIQFASLQSPLGQDYLKHFNLPVDDFQSYIVIDEDGAFQKSQAVYKMAYHMGGKW